MIPARRFAVFVTTLVAAAALSPLAASARPAQPQAAATSKVVKVANLGGYFSSYGDGIRPAAFVTAHKTVLAAWLNYTPSGQQALMIGRKTKSGRTFATRKLYALPEAGNPYLGRLGGGKAIVAMIADENKQTFDAWRSVNDGKSWQRMNLSTLNGKLASAGLMPDGNSVVDANGATYAQLYVTSSSTSEVVKLAPSLTSFSVVQQSSANNTLSIAAGHGTVFSVVEAGYSPFPFGAGKHTGSVSFPCGQNLQVGARLAGTKSGAVALASGCGHVYARSISPSGKLGKVKILAAAPGGTITGGGAGHLAVTTINGTARVLFSDASGDLRSASTTNGTAWHVGRGLLPMVAGGGNDDGGPIPALSGGSSTWAVAETSTNSGTQTGAVFAAPTAATYVPPSLPSRHGLGKTKSARLGSFAVTAPVSPSHKKFKYGKDAGIGVRVHSAVTDTVTVDVSVEKISGGSVYFLYGATLAKKVRAGKTLTITPKTYVEEKIGKKDAVIIEVTGRTGGLTFNGKTS